MKQKTDFDTHYAKLQMIEFSKLVPQLMENMAIIKTTMMDMKDNFSEKLNQFEILIKNCMDEICCINKEIHNNDFQNAMKILRKKYGRENGYSILEKDLNRKVKINATNEIIKKNFVTEVIKYVIAFLFGGGVLVFFDKITEFIRHKG